MKNLEKEIKNWENSLQKEFVTISSLENWEEVNTKFLGKKSVLKDFFKIIKNLSTEEKQIIAPLIQNARENWTTKLQNCKISLENKVMNEKLANDWIDVSKQKPFSRGSIHPLNQLQKEVEDIFVTMGFDIADGPEVETEWFNFDALNIADDHPARDMQDTFWVKNDSKISQENLVLRTQTSGVQVREMLKNGAPLRLICPGRVYRNEEVDTTHDTTFYQVEGLVIDKDISLVNLKGTIKVILNRIFKKEMKIRIRPGYFPFVEPGLEVDIWFEYRDKDGKKQGKWLEFMGAGMVHDKVLEAGKISREKYNGFAFGFGLTRLVMIKYGIEDIRLLFSKNPDFLQQF